MSHVFVLFLFKSFIFGGNCFCVFDFTLNTYVWTPNEFCHGAFSCHMHACKVSRVCIYKIFFLSLYQILIKKNKRWRSYINNEGINNVRRHRND